MSKKYVPPEVETFIYPVPDGVGIGYEAKKSAISGSHIIFSVTKIWSSSQERKNFEDIQIGFTLEPPAGTQLLVAFDNTEGEYDHDKELVSPTPTPAGVLRSDEFESLLVSITNSIRFVQKNS